MKKLTLLAVTILSLMVMVEAGYAVPRLQTYIVGSAYHDFYRQEFQSWVTNSADFDIKVVGYWHPADELPMSGYKAMRSGPDYMDCFLLVSTPQGQAGRIYINGIEMTSFGDYSSNIPDGVNPRPSLRCHMPVLGSSVAFQEIGRIDNSAANAYQYSSSGLCNPGWGDEILLNIVVQGYSWAHFDAAGIDAHGRTYTSPYSSDASYYNNCATPEPGTLSLLGLGLLGIIPILRRKRD